MPASQTKGTPITAVRSSNVLTVEVDQAQRYAAFFHLLTAALHMPEDVEEDLDRLRWDLVYDSITAPKQAERIAHEANHLLEV